MKFLYLTAVFFCLCANAADEFCAFNFNYILPRITVKVEHLENGEYKYLYEVSNETDSHLPLIWFFIETNLLAEKIKSPIKWEQMNWDKIKPEWSKWSTSELREGDVKQGTSLSGFEFISKNPPGFVKYRSRGANYLPLKTSNVLKGDVLRLCPGSYQAGSSAMGFDQIDGITIGPVPTNRKSVDLRIKRVGEKTKWSGSLNTPNKELLSFSPLEKGKVEVALIENESLELSEVDATTLEFGSGKAKPLSVNISECEISDKERVKAILLKFNLEDVNVLCNADHAIFLTGKTKKGADIFGGVKIKATECNQENWQREAQKMIEAGELDLPKGNYKAKK